MKGSLKTPKNNSLIYKVANSSSRKLKKKKIYERVLLDADSNTKKAYRILCTD
jgi:hypothetical protein